MLIITMGKVKDGEVSSFAQEGFANTKSLYEAIQGELICVFIIRRTLHKIESTSC